MSEKKKVIHVKDLVIKADNVYVEPQRHHRRRDPFFGMWGGYPEQEQAERSESSSHHEYQEDEHGHDEDESGDNRRPFSWM